jgi:hypothetical protein
MSGNYKIIMGHSAVRTCSCSQTNPLKHKRLARAVFYLTQEGGYVTLMKGLSRVMLMFVFSFLKV